MGTGAQECCFFYPGFLQGSKSALQKGFCFPQHAADCCACQPLPRLQEPGCGHPCPHSQVLPWGQGPSWAGESEDLSCQGR